MSAGWSAVKKTRICVQMPEEAMIRLKDLSQKLNIPPNAVISLSVSRLHQTEFPLKRVARTDGKPQVEPARKDDS